MKHIFFNIRQSRYFLLFILVFAYIQSIQVRFLVRRTLDWFIFTPEAAVASFINACILFVIMLYFLRRRQRQEIFNLKDALKIFGASLLAYSVIMQLAGLLLALIFDTFERNFNQESFISGIIGNFMNVLIYGSFFLAYYYYRTNKRARDKISLYNKALSESKINQLKTQLDPHFLFNNLNILDQFIEEDRYKASAFLNEFAEIYRYVLETTDKKLVPIEEELRFAKSYFSLMQHKYLNAYRLEVQQKEPVIGQIVPLSLQLLLENAIGHNLGTENDPVTIRIGIGENIEVSNNLSTKKSHKTTSGRALRNLAEQYNMLSQQKIMIKESEAEFLVILPVISTNK